MPDIEIRRDRVRVFVIVLCKKSHVLRAEEISGINKAGKYMLSVERAAFVPIDVLSDLDYFAVRNSHVALEHFPIADMKRCIFRIILSFRRFPLKSSSPFCVYAIAIIKA